MSIWNKKDSIKKILKNKSNVIKNKIGSKNIHIEENKSVLEMGINITKNVLNIIKLIQSF